MEEQDKDNRQNQEDVIPGSALDKIVDDPEKGNLPKTNGTGANNPVPTDGSVVIKKED
ncbi:hypothetical protein [Pedobacter sp.]|uniref:hypothetical protein n=1 Tax=Pedobacter sp. TaxID=1411316 RepID=UPI003D7F7D9E